VRLHIGCKQSSRALPKVRSIPLVPGWDEQRGVSLLRDGYAAGVGRKYNNRKSESCAK